MDLNELQLSPSLLADLYKSSLLDDNSGKEKNHPPANEKAGTEAGIRFLGKNNKGICILVNYSNEIYLPDTHLQFLTSILQACKLNMADVAIINSSKQKININNLQNDLACKYLLVFGSHPPEMELPQTGMFEIKQIKNIPFLLSPGCDELNSNSAVAKALKSKLWGCLKQLFQV